MSSNHSVKIPLAPELYNSTRSGHILDNQRTGSLISIGQLCDNDCAAIFKKYNVLKNGNIIIKTHRNKTNGLWNIPLAPQSTPPTTEPRDHLQSDHSAITMHQTKANLAVLLHGTVFIPIP